MRHLGGKVIPSASQLAALSRLFSSAVIRDLAKKGKSSQFARLLAEALPDIDPERCVADAFEEAFVRLRSAGRRDDYVYRAALTHKVLKGVHSLRTACMLQEFRVGACKADVVILNGTATVYEIKSERDTLARLENQIKNYKKVFAKVVVIASQDHVDEILKVTSADVGVLSLSKRFQISSIREAKDRADKICPMTVFDSLTSIEARIILEEFGVALPNIPNTQFRKVARKHFQSLKPLMLHRAMVKTLKKTRSLEPLGNFIECLPWSIQPAALSIPLRKLDRDRLIGATETPLRLALKWAH